MTQRHEGNPLRELLGVLIVGVSLLGTSACGPKAIAQDEEGTSSSQSTAETTDTQTTSPAETGTETSTMGPTSTATDSDDSSDSQTNTSGGFYAGPDVDVGPGPECDPWQQDCPEGEKCVAYGSTGGAWDANKCVPVTGDAQVGEPCTYDGTAPATDDCDELSYCWMALDAGEMATCTAFCTGTPDDPVCAEGTTCLITGSGSINLCLERCDPLLQACAEGSGCYWGNTDFMCIETWQAGIPTGEPCGSINDCVPGNTCLNADVLPGCEGSACCGTFCDLDDLEACPDPELSCMPFFEPRNVLEGFENVGVCILLDP